MPLRVPIVVMGNAVVLSLLCLSLSRCPAVTRITLNDPPNWASHMAIAAVWSECGDAPVISPI